MIPNTTPGEILKEEFMEPHGLSMNRLASMIKVPTNRISAIVNGSRSITADTALRLSKCFGNSAEFWMNIQRDHDIADAVEKNTNIIIEVVA